LNLNISEVNFTGQFIFRMYNQSMNADLHEVQASILRELLFHNGTTFSSLNKLDLTNDHFTFHIKRLLAEEVIEKKGKLYYLTQKGKQYAGKLDVYGLKMEKFGTPGVAVSATKIIDGKLHFLIQQRLKEPMYGYYGFINGKIKFGEFSEETAKRELLEETGLTGEPKFICIQHRLRGPSREEIKLDHYFFIYMFDEPEGELKHSEEGKNYWFTLEKIADLNTFPGFEYSLNVVTGKDTAKYIETFVKVEEI
jgi:8-oxo-dGTP diphosphatase